jgi:hypothetical protein
MQTEVEEYRPVHDAFYGLGGGYLVSNFGTIKNRNGRILKGHNVHGYRQVTLHYLGISQSFYVHRLVASTFIGESDSRLDEVNHKDLDKLNNRVDNLEWMPKGDNIRHAKLHGHDGRRFTDEQEREIVALRKRGWTYQRIAGMFGCSKRRIWAIYDRKTKSTDQVELGWFTVWNMPNR